MVEVLLQYLRHEVVCSAGSSGREAQLADIAKKGLGKAFSPMNSDKPIDITLIGSLRTSRAADDGENIEGHNPKGCRKAATV